MSRSLTQLRITDAEYRARCDRLLHTVRAQRLSGVVLFDADYIKYYTGFYFIPTERPMAFVMSGEGERVLFVPRLELEHARANAVVERVEDYPEYPGDLHPMQHLVHLLQATGITGAIGADHDGYPWILGYRGEKLSHLGDFSISEIRAAIEDQLMIKSEAEIALLRESVKWGHLAHTLLQRYTTVGATETDVADRASREATRAMLDAIGPLYRAQSGFFDHASAHYRGQIGRNSVIPHALANNITFRQGDVLVTGATAPIWGYVSELERTMILGEPTDEQRHYFQHMLNLQEIALERLAPGVLCRDVDQAVRAYYEKHDLMPYWKHHSGHAIGLRYHESPFLDIGDSTLIQTGMVFTVEPGLYVTGLGGFRHSDTVLITESGIEILTYYPRDLDSLTIPCP